MALQSCFCRVFLVVVMTVQLHCLMGNTQRVRFRGPQSTNEGQVIVRLNRTWHAVCAQNWDDHDAKAACHELGYSGGKNEDKDIRRGVLPFLPWKFNCSGGDTVLSKCDRAPVTCRDDHRAAYAICSGTTTETTIELTTLAGDYDSMTGGPIPVTVAAAVGASLGFLLLLAVLLFFLCRRRARNHEDNTTSKPDKGTDHVGMGELGTTQDKDGENTYQTIQESAVNSRELPAVPTAPPSEDNENYSTIPDLKSLSTEDRVDERAPAPPPNQSEQGVADYYSVVRDNGTASFAEDQAKTLDTVKTSQEPEYAVVKKASKHGENKTEESDDTLDQGIVAHLPEYAVVNKIRKKDQKVEGKEDDQYGMVDNVTYEPF